MSQLWPTRPIWALTTESRSVVDPSSLGREVLHYSIPALEATGLPEHVSSDDIKSQKLRVEGGEVLVSRLNPRKSRIALVAPVLGTPIVASTEFVPLFPRSVETRFLIYTMLSESTRQYLDSCVRSVTRSHQRVDPEVITHMVITLPPEGEQRRIADFLDDQVARIDAIVRLREEQVASLAERLGRRADALVADAAVHGWVKLKYTADVVTVGIVVTPSAWYADDGVIALRGTNIKPDAITLDDLVYLTREGHRIHPKSRLHEGDVVVVRTGQAGAAAVVPAALDGANAIDILIVRPKTAVVPEFMSMALNAPSIRDRTAATVVGAIQGHFNVSTLAQALLPDAPNSKQREIADEWQLERESVARLLIEMRSQVDLLRERKRSLITAAVTGEFDVTTASGRGVV